MGLRHNIRKLFQRQLRFRSTQSWTLSRTLAYQPGATTKKSSQKVNHDDITQIRNIGIIAHIDAGKTTTTERMLYYADYTRTLGEVDDGDTVMDYMKEERDRGITITSAAIRFPWKQTCINLIDTPGHVDFTIEVGRALRVLDGAVAIFDASAGVEAQSITVWNQADQYKVPRIAYLNKMDKPAANVKMSIDSIRRKLRANPMLLHIPLPSGGKQFSGVADVVSMRKMFWNQAIDRHGRQYESLAIEEKSDGPLFEACMNARTELIENLANTDSAFADLYLTSEAVSQIDEDAINSALRRTTLNRTGVPVLIGSSFKNKGVQLLLDAVVQFLPNPSMVEHGFHQFYNKNDLCALAFKVIHDKQKGTLVFLRVYSGIVERDQKLYNASRDAREKAVKLYQPFANEFEEVARVTAGNIAVVSGLDVTVTGDTLVDSKETFRLAKQKFEKQDLLKIGANVDYSVLAGIQVPEPVYFCSIEPASMMHQKTLDYALACMRREDPSLRIESNAETGQTVLHGMGELHLEIIRDRIHNEYKAEVELGPMQVSYRETLVLPVTEKYTLDRTLGETRHLVNITLSALPCKGGHLEKKIKMIYNKETQEHMLAIRHYHLEAVQSGIEMALKHGPLMGYPILDVAFCLHWLEVGPRTSEAMISSCAIQCVNNIMKKGAAKLLEPIMKLEIVVNDERGGMLGVILGDLSSRQAQIESVGVRMSDEQDSPNIKVVRAYVGLTKLSRYSTVFRTLTSGTATLSMEFDSYKPVSAVEQNRLVPNFPGLGRIRLE